MSLIDSSRPLSPQMSMMDFSPILGLVFSNFKTMEGKDSVLIYHRHNVGSNAHGTEVEQRDES